MKSRRMRWAAHTEHMGKTEICTSFCLEDLKEGDSLEALGRD
jgi:hypothetical protein